MDAAASDKVYQLLAHGRWFSPGTPASFTTKTGRHDIAEILLRVPLSTINQIKSNKIVFSYRLSYIQIILYLYYIFMYLINFHCQYNRHQIICISPIKALYSRTYHINPWRYQIILNYVQIVGWFYFALFVCCSFCIFFCIFFSCLLLYHDGHLP